MDETISISGTVEEIIYSNPENGYTVCDVETTDGKLVTVIGYMPYVTEGENVIITGRWTTHPEYGEQLRADFCENVLPTDEEAIEKYLASGIISGIRAATAKKLVAHFGTEIFEVMLTKPERLSEIKGISEDRALKIGASYKELQSMRSIVMFLQQYHISANTAVKVHNALGANAVDAVKENPYILSDRVDGISFKTSDTIAFNMGIPSNSSTRIRAGLKYILTTAAYSDGHTYLPKSALIEHGAYILSVEEDEIESALSELVMDNAIFCDRVDNTEAYYLYPFYEAEYYIARRLCSLAMAEQKFTMTASQAESAIDDYEKNHGIALASEQRNAVVTALSAGCMVLTGGPGTGKTTVIKAILELLKSLKLSVALAAPTGRAAKRMSQVTGYEAKTIHRLLGTQQGTDGNFHGFVHNETNPLTAEVLIIDEVSMIDVNLMSSLLHALKHGARVIFSGDADQLPSVGPGNVLRDIIKSDAIPVTKLNKIFRQAEESLIIVNAHKINRGELPEIGVHSSDFFFLKRQNPESSAFTVMDLYLNRLPSTYNLNPLTSIQVLSPTKKGITGTENLNRLLQANANPPSSDKAEHTYGKTLYREGDKVMQIKNNYDMEYSVVDGERGMGIFNGDMGVIESINEQDNCMTIVFDEDKRVSYPFNFLDELDLAYAITVHKSQGSEFPVVVMPAVGGPPMLLTRNLLYTAVTRARRLVMLVGREAAIDQMITNVYTKKRYSALTYRIKLLEDL